MSLDGLRAWIGEVERKLGIRTRVFLVLAVIAIGGAGAAIYLAIDTRENAVSESDVQTLQRELEARIAAGAAAGATGATAPTGEPAPTPAPEPEATEPKAKPPQSAKPKGGAAKPEQGGGGASSGGGSANGEASNGGPSARSKGLQKLLENAKKANEEAERNQAGGK